MEDLNNKKMKKLNKICIISTCISLCLAIIWFIVGCIYEVHYGNGIIISTPSLFWMIDVLWILLGIGIISTFGIIVTTFELNNEN